jgi:hypothetical protein
LSSWSKGNDNAGKKSNDEGKKEQKSLTGRKNVFEVNSEFEILRASLTEFEIQNLFCSSSDRLIHANLSSFFMLG